MNASYDRRRPESQTYSADEVAAILGIGRSTVYERVQRGVFPIRALPGLGRVRFAKADVDRYLTSTDDWASQQEPTGDGQAADD